MPEEDHRFVRRHCNHSKRTSARGDDDHSDYDGYPAPIHSAFMIESGTE